MTRRSHTRLHLESLEERTVLDGGGLGNPLPGFTITAQLTAGVLKVFGTPYDDNITLKQTNGVIRVLGVNGAFPAAAVSKIEVLGLAGKDWIRLDSESVGGQPLTKPSLIKGGDGDDLVFGSYGADQIFGELGNDILHGKSGNDRLDGGPGRDSTYGGPGNDTIPIDFTDQFHAGQTGSDVISFTRLDPAPLASNNPTILKAAVQSGLNGVSFSKTSNGTKFSVKNLTVDTVTIQNGITTIALQATVRVQQFVFGREVASSTGSVKFTLNPKLSASLTDLTVTTATIGLANVHVTQFNLNNVPNWIDNASEVRDFLESKFAGIFLNYKTQLQTILALGGSLGPTLVA
jgi:hypothetical protein